MAASRVRFLERLDSMEYLRKRMRKQSFRAHCHETFVVEFIERGQDSCSIAGDSADRGQAWLHLPGAAHTGGSTSDEELVYSAVYPSQDVVARLLGRPIESLGTGQSLVVRDPRLNAILRQYFALDLEHDAHSDALLAEFLDRALADPHLRDRSAQDEGLRLDDLRRYLQRNCTRKVSSHEMSEVTGLSRFHMIRRFRQTNGITPHQYLLSARVARAKDLLLDGSTIVEAAMLAGFSDQSHLTRCFKHVLGYSPGTLRRAI